jgi:homoserine O-acetyltransferase
VVLERGVSATQDTGLAPVPTPGRPNADRRHLSSGSIASTALGPFELESGERLPELVLAWRHDGPGPADAPQVLVVHALTGSADAAGDWWEPVIGPGRALDTDRVGVLCANLLGGRYGSTGPTSIEPGRAEPWGERFPRVGTRDQARALWRLTEALGIERLALVAGGSLGGMVTLEVALEHPERTRHAMPIAAPAATGPMAVAWNRIQHRLIELLGDEGLAIARQLAMTTYRSEADFDGRFGRQREADGRFSIVSYLDHQGRKLVDRFDGHTYRALAAAMDAHDVGHARGGVQAALGSLAAHGVRLTGVGIQDDILYGPRQVRALVDAAHAAGVATRYREIRSDKGHDAFLVEWDQLGAILREGLQD